MYILGLALVAPLVLLLPMLYLALIAGAAWGAYWHATANTGILAGQGVFLRASLYAGPLVGGLFIVLMLLKPLFARPVQEADPYSLEPEQEPIFHAFVAKVADAVGAPIPRRIEVNCIPNASASFHRGLLGLLRRDLVLTVGTPLIASLNTRQLAALIAHELGHFSQTLGMGLTGIIASITQWFARAAFEPDEWDEQMANLLEEGCLGHVLGPLLVVVQLCVLVTRLILFVFALIAALLTMFLMRQMEYDADVYAARVAGFDALAPTFERISEANIGFEELAGQLEDAVVAGTLPDDIPAYLLRRSEASQWRLNPPRTSPPRLLLRIMQLLVTHPPTVLRVERVQREGSEGVYRYEAPASDLLRHFETICKWTTLGLYHKKLGPHVQIGHLKPLPDDRRHRELRAAGHAASRRFFQGTLHPAHKIFPDATSLRGPIPAQEARETLARARKAIIRDAPGVRGRVVEIIDLEQTLVKAMDDKTLTTDEALIAPPSSLRRRQHGGKDSTPKMSATLEVLRREIGTFDRLVERRLKTVLSMLKSEPMAASPGKTENLERHADLLLEVLEFLRVVEPITDDTRISLGAIRHLWVHEDDKPEGSLTNARAAAAAKRLRRAVKKLRPTMLEAPRAVTRCQRGILPPTTVSGTAAPLDTIGQIYRAAFSLVNQLNESYGDVIGRLAIIAERVERAAGLDPLPQPYDDVLRVPLRAPHVTMEY
jgi:Zn-dependent protease with chaperone function